MRETMLYFILFYLIVEEKIRLFRIELFPKETEFGGKKNKGNAISVLAEEEGKGNSFAFYVRRGKKR